MVFSTPGPRRPPPTPGCSFRPPSELTLGDDTGTGAIKDNELAFGVVFWAPAIFHYEEGDTVRVPFRRLVPLDPDGVVTTEDDCYQGVAANCFHTDLNPDPGIGPLTVNLDISQEGDFISGAIPDSVTFPAGQVVAGTATEGLDYQETGGKVTFPLGTTSGIIEVNLVNPDGTTTCSSRNWKPLPSN